jgi:acyl-CoA synthetase (AMP-forming)/AMP-acid ligase II
VSINSGGEKISPEEVEKALKSHPAIFDATVVGTPHERFGKQVSAVVSLREGHDYPGDEPVTDHCREHLAGYKVPRAIVVVDEVVRSPSGKPDYRWAAATAAEALT